MRSGALDRRITIEQMSTSKNGVGEEIQTWSTLATVWAQRSPQGVVQKYNNQQSYGEVDAIFRTRWFPWATVVDVLTHRITYRGRVYDIQGSEEIGRREGLFILTKARADNEDGTA